MNQILRTVRLLTMVVWVGGLVFFAFVEAPTAFHVMGTNRQFALLIGQSLSKLNEVGQLCGFVFLLATVATRYRQGCRSSLLTAQMLLVLLMILATVQVQASIIPAMESDRIAAGGDIDAVPKDNPARMDFDRLHARSEKVEGAALLFGLGIVVLMGFEESISMGDFA
jgi:uncharacterized membrane protein